MLQPKGESKQSCAFNEGIKTREQKEEENLSSGVALIYPTDNERHLLSSRFGNFAPIAKHASSKIQTQQPGLETLLSTRSGTWALNHPPSYTYPICTNHGMRDLVVLVIEAHGPVGAL